ncbi:MAG TPA: DUF1559 domain-containing protein [Planctomycetaceae bacterium]|nr:DUF1559 domain-containing protein [Planctomycetaceae bacterium]
MNEQLTHRSPTAAVVLWIAVPTITGLICLFGAPEYVEQLVLGWIYFPLRTIPRMTADWPTLILGTVSSLMFVATLHRTMQWFCRTGVDMANSGASRWTWRSSLLASAMLFVLFASGTALVGATHQAVWILSGRGDSISETVTPRELGFMAQARDAARSAQAKNELKMFGLAFHNFHDVYGAFPPGGTMNEDGELLHGWIAFLGDFHSFTTQNIQFQKSWNSPPNDQLYKCQMSCFLNPSQPGPVFDANGYGLCHWAGNVQVLPIVTAPFPPVTSRDGSDGFTTILHESGQVLSLKQITDGTSNTILLGSVGQNFRPWGYPANVRDPALGVNRSPDGFGGPPGWNGGQFALCDGSVAFLSDKTDLSIMKALATPAGGETLPADFGR